MTDLSDLIARLEAATGADRAIDYDIAHLTGDHFANHGKAPAYTASLDAALTLVDAGDEFILNYSRMSVDMGGRNWRCMVGKTRATGRTPALALTIAALKARAS